MNSNNKIWGTLLKVALGLILVLSFLQVKMKFGWDPVKEYLCNDSCVGIHDSIQKIESITIPKHIMEIKIGHPRRLQAQIMPADADNKKLNWHSNDTTVAYVDSTGLVTATAKGGRCIITATTTDGSNKSDSIIIVVDNPVISTTDTDIKVETINILNSNGKITLNIDSIFKVKVEVLPKTASNKMLKWMSDNEGVAIVDNDGIIRAKGKGDCTLTVSTLDGGNASPKEIDVHVQKPEKDVKVTSIVLDKSKTINVGGQTQIHAKIFPANANNKTLKWETSDRSVATVNNGKIVGVGEGECTIRATSTDGGNIPSSQCVVSVKPIAKMKLPYGEWTGDYLNGKPNGQGTIVFDKSVLVTDVPDDIYAHKGYTFRNVRFENGKLKFGGILYDSDGREIKRILSDIKL